MNIAVVAANGRTGQAFVAAALAAGHSVRAGARGTSSLQGHPQLVVVRCDATKLADIEELLRGADAVVSLIGHKRGSPAELQTLATKNIVQAMEASGQKRVVSLTGTGVRQPGDKITIIDRILNLSIATIDPKRINDGISHTQVLQGSPLDYTVIRVLKLQNTKPRPYQLKLHGPAKVIVSRDEVAQAILEVLSDGSFMRQAPILGKS